MKKILIIGANGFTGRQILNDLSACKQYNAPCIRIFFPITRRIIVSSKQIYGMKRTLSVSSKRFNPM